MSDTKFTPGPWRAGRADMATIVGGVDSKWIYDVRDQYVAVASGRIDGEWDEVMANAHLIAAAPELYKALERLHYALDSCVDLTPKLLLKCRAALAKARGEA